MPCEKHSFFTFGAKRNAINEETWHIYTARSPQSY